MKRLISAVLCMIMLCTILCTPAFAIKDVTTYEPEDVMSEERFEKESVSDWAVNEVEAAQRLGLIPELTGDPAFKDTITREQFAELAVQMVTVALGETPNTTGAETFTDTTNEKIIQAAAAGIVNGMGDGTFAPKANTTREQIATMIYRSIVYIDNETGINIAPAAGDISKFTDKDLVSYWAVRGVSVLASNGIMNGTSDTTLDPQSSCTVEQSILLLYRVYAAFKAA